MLNDMRKSIKYSIFPFESLMFVAFLVDRIPNFSMNIKKESIDFDKTSIPWN